jgi:Tol biopolymer transport system component
VFQKYERGMSSLWAVRASGGRAVQITTGPLSIAAPVFRRDGRQIFAIATQRRGELVRYDPKRSSFDLFLSGLSADHVEFSRDRQWIAYSAYPQAVLWRSRVDGSSRLRLSPASEGLSAWFPRWSPDGSRIAFMGSRPDEPVRIYVVPASGGTPEPILVDKLTQVDPNWSPNGDSLMFATAPSATGLGSSPPKIQILNLKTHKLSTLAGSEGLTAPRWSPDGRFVIATALSSETWRKPGVLIFDFETQRWSGLEDDPIDNKWWSADGKYFYFDKYTNNDPAIFRIRMSDRQLERVVGLGDIRRSPGVMGWWMGLTPEGLPMVLRDTSIEEIYALDWHAP